MESGKQYNIGQILSGYNVLQIPDMQRDYCWANTFSDLNGKSLVFNFLNDLIEQSKAEQELQMGLMYAYESPKHYIQLCDGQQRLTTIYLIISLLYKKLGKPEEIKEHLLTNSTNEITPRFQYTIRETTMAFLTDFVQTLLAIKTTQKITITFIKSQDWYFNEYNQDPSIQNLLTAIAIIEEKLIDLEIDKAKLLSDFLLHKVSFLYFDMQNRTFGEEQFVVLNTTGKPLTKTENLKPKFLEDFVDSKTNNENLKKYAEMWEDWEDYFWLNKSSKHKNADFGLNEFFRWVYIIEQSKKERETTLDSKPEHYNKAQLALAKNNFNILELSTDRLTLFELVNSYFLAINKLFSIDKFKAEFLGKQNRLSQIDNFVFLSLLTFTQQNNVENVSVNISLKRLNNFLRNRKKDDNVSKASITTSIEAIRTATLLSNQDDIANYEKYESVISSTLLNTCEKFKFNVLRNSGLERKSIEKAFWDAENLNTTNGNIQFIFDALDIDINKNDSFIDLKKFMEIHKIITETLEKNTDLTRRALLTFGDYSIHHGYSTTLGAHRYTLGNKSIFYGELANNGDSIRKKILKDFLKQINTDSDINLQLNRLIDNYVIANKTIEEETISKIIKDKDLLNYMQYNLYCIGDNNQSYALNRQKTMGEHSYKKVVNQLTVIETL